MINLIKIAHATADPEFASTSPQLATLVKDNIFSGIFNQEVLIAIASVIGLFMVICFLVMFFPKLMK